MRVSGFNLCSHLSPTFQSNIKNLPTKKKEHPIQQDTPLPFFTQTYLFHYSGHKPGSAIGHPEDVHAFLEISNIELVPNRMIDFAVGASIDT